MITNVDNQVRTLVILQTNRKTASFATHTFARAFVVPLNKPTVDEDRSLTGIEKLNLCELSQSISRRTNTYAEVVSLLRGWIGRRLQTRIAYFRKRLPVWSASFEDLVILLVAVSGEPGDVEELGERAFDMGLVQ